MADPILRRRVSPTIGSLCTGYGGIEIALHEVLGAVPVWHADPDPAAARLLAHHHHDIPNHGDITATDWSRVAPVDILTGGWPCQPWSLAGRRKGAADERAIWPEVARAVRVLRPRLVVLENVSAIAAAGELARAVTDLAALGYVGSWRCLRAADVGAPHRRERIFIVAWPAGENAGSDYNDGDDVLGWFGWKITGDVLTITHERDIPRDMVSRRWRLVPLDTDEEAP